MPPRLRPVDHEARLTVVEHLGELRTRLFICLAMVAVAFAFTYWKHNAILEVINRPLVESQQTTNDNSKNGDPIQQGQRFDKQVAQALDSLAPALEQLSSTTDDLPTTGATQAQRRALQQRIAEVRQTAAALRKAAAIAPNASSRKPVTLGVTEPFFQTLTVAGYAALVIVLPLILYQLYAFLIPAFTKSERRAIVPMLILVPLLFYGGVAFGYFLALPRAVDFLQNFNQNNFDVLVQAKDYFKFVALFLAGTGVVFQIPVVVLIVTRLGIITPRQLRKQRRYVILGAAVVAAVITPTPDPFTMLLVMSPLYVLFEASVVVASILERRRPGLVRRGWWNEDDDPDDEDDPDDDPDPDGPSPWDTGDSDPYGFDEVDDEDDPDEDGSWAWDDDEGTYEHEVAVPAGTPRGEEPDPALAGDPAGPRLATDPDDDAPTRRVPPLPSTAEHDLVDPDDAPRPGALPLPPTAEHDVVDPDDDPGPGATAGSTDDDDPAGPRPSDDDPATARPAAAIDEPTLVHGVGGPTPPTGDLGSVDDASAFSGAPDEPRRDDRDRPAVSARPDEHAPTVVDPPEDVEAPAGAGARPRARPRPRPPGDETPARPLPPLPAPAGEEGSEPWWLAADDLDAEDPFADLEAERRRRRPDDGA